jgi:hypothetical protein
MPVPLPICPLNDSCRSTSDVRVGAIFIDDNRDRRYWLLTARDDLAVRGLYTQQLHRINVAADPVAAPGHVFEHRTPCPAQRADSIADFNLGKKEA